MTKQTETSEVGKTRLTTQDLVAILAEEHDLSKKHAQDILYTVLEAIATTVVNRGTVAITNFGTFHSSSRKAYLSGLTGEMVRPTVQARFRPSPTLNRMATYAPVGRADLRKLPKGALSGE